MTMHAPFRRRAAGLVSLMVGLGLVAALETGLAGAQAPAGPVHQQAPVDWHAQSGSSGAVGTKAVGSLVRRDGGISFRLNTTDLRPGHAYTVWLVIINHPEECAASTCTADDIFHNPEVNAQVTFGAGHVVGKGGRAGFAGQQPVGPIEEGWITDRGLERPRHAQIQLTLNDHGPTISGMVDEMIHTYRAGCTDESLPPIFPATARADGTPGPNTCRLYQSAVFP